jgi:hypothetical protein
MDLDAFKGSTTRREPPPELAPAIQALWWDAKGEWSKAHERAQAQENKEGAWVHAYLHRKEGDLANAGYWYRRAGKPVASGSFDIEWEAIARALLAHG